MSHPSLSFRPSFFSVDNAIGIAASVVLHGVLLLVIMYHWVPDNENRKVVRPKFIEAKLLQMEPAIAQQPAPEPKAQPKPEPQPKVDEAAQRRAEEQRRQEQARKEEQRRQAQQRAEAERKEAEARKRQQELERKQQEEARRREQERQKELQRQEQLKKEQERKRQQELEHKRQQELARALAMEEAAMEEAELAGQVGTYVDYMASLIASNWNRPPSARLGMKAVLLINLGSGGRVTGVQVSESSGNPAFDRSAEQAVWKVGQFSRLKEMDPALYQREFRKIYLEFNPQDLRK